MKEQGLITSTIILTITSFLTRTLGMISTIFLSNLLGTEGIGLYQLIMSIYMVAIVFASAGLSISVSKLIAEELGQKHFANVPKVMLIAFKFSFFMGIFIAFLLFTCSSFIATHFIEEPSATLCLKILSLSIPLMACSSCFKGYFYATKKAIYPASGEILEQTIKLGLTILLVSFYHSTQKMQTYALIGLSITIGEVVSWSYYFSLYLISRKEQPKPTPHLPASSGSLLLKLFRIGLPLAFISYISCIFVSAENVLIPAGLKKFGASPEISLSLYGMLKGMVLPILFFPSAFLTAFSTTLIPEIARSNILGYQKRVRQTTNRVLQLTFILSILVASIFINYPTEFGLVLYQTTEIGPMLMILALIVPFMYIEVVSDGILTGMGKQVSCLKYSILDSIFRISTIYLFIPIKGINALIIVMLISNIMTSTLTFSKLLEEAKTHFQFSNWVLKPIVAALAGGSFSRLLLSRLFPQLLTPKFILFWGILLTVIIYISLLFLVESLTNEDVLWLKKHFSLKVKN